MLKFSGFYGLTSCLGRCLSCWECYVNSQKLSHTTPTCQQQLEFPQAHMCLCSWRINTVITKSTFPIRCASLTQASALRVPRRSTTHTNLIHERNIACDTYNPWHTNALNQQSPRAKDLWDRDQSHRDTLLSVIKREDSEADRPSGMSRKHRIHSRFYWFTEFCNSQCLSHFAAPFISVQAKTFIAEGCNWDIRMGRIPSETKQGYSQRVTGSKGDEQREMSMWPKSHTHLPIESALSWICPGALPS